MTNAQGIICRQRKIACLRVYTRSRCCEALDNVCKIQMLYVVSYMCTIVGVYSCAVDANQLVSGRQQLPQDVQPAQPLLQRAEPGPMCVYLCLEPLQVQELQ